MMQPFPSNGPGANPFFDGHSLQLLKGIGTPPDYLEKNIDRLGKELENLSSALDSSLDVPWPIAEESPLGKLITRDALSAWDYDLFKLKEASNGHALVYLSHGFIQMLDLVNVLGLDEAVLHRYLPASKRF
jgi:hypothetical protein